MQTDTANGISYFARTNFRGDHRTFGIRQRDRRYHMYIIGKTGTGKTTLIETLAVQDIVANRGFAVIDPHGDLYESLRSKIPPSLTPRLIDFNLPASYDRLSFNPLANVPESKRILAASSMLATFRKLWSSYWGPKMEHFLRNALLTLLETPNTTLADIPKIFQDRVYRSRIVSRISNRAVQRFWINEYNKIPDRYKADAVSPIMNRTGAFLSNPITQRLLTKDEGNIDFRAVLDKGSILLVNLAKGKLGEDTTYLVGGLLMSSIEVAALSRADIAEENRSDYNVYLDEFQNYTTESLASMMSEMRKYRVSLTLANQFLSQVDKDVRDGILGNAGTLISFRIGAIDARLFVREFLEKYRILDFVNLPNHSIYLRMMIDGAVSKPFSANTVLSTEATIGRKSCDLVNNRPRQRVSADRSQDYFTLYGVSG